MLTRRAVRGALRAWLLVLAGLVSAAAGMAVTRLAPEPGHPPPARPAARSAAVSPRQFHALVALGDSVPSGLGCGCDSYVDLVGKRLSRRQHRHVHVANLAVPGATTGSVLAQLQEPSTHRALGRADLVLLNVGANDLDPAPVARTACADPTRCYQEALSTVRRNLAAILRQVRAQAAPGAEVIATGYWNVFLDGSVGAALGRSYRVNSDALTRALNAAVAQATPGTGARYVDVYTPFKASGDDTSLLQADGDHPDAAGHAVLATAVLNGIDAA